MKNPKMLTKRTWPNYVVLGDETEATTHAMFGQLDAAEALIPVLERMSKLKTIEEFKTAIAKLIKKEKDLIEDSKEWANTKFGELLKKADNIHGHSPRKTTPPRLDS